MTPLRLTLLAAGFCTAPEAAAVAGGRWRARRFPAGFALVEGHGAGPVLFDTGYAPRILAATRPFPYRLYAWATPVQQGISRWRPILVVCRVGSAP